MALELICRHHGCVTAELPDPADAMFSAELLCRRAAELPSADPTAVQDVLTALLEAAGGADVGNAVRRHVERAPQPGYGIDRSSPTEARAQILEAAARLFLAAEEDVRSALAAAGLTPVPQASAAADGDAAAVPDTDGNPIGRRAARAAFAERTLTRRRAAVETVLRAMGGPPWPTEVSSPA